MCDLAIVIPAYKGKYLRKTLSSIAAQTDKGFTLYIGDDDSPDGIESIVNEYQNLIHIIYKKFDQNLGKTDIVSHWQRCIELVKSEKWIWFFSDDDYMSPNCVEAFHKTILDEPNLHLLYRFNVNTVNNDGLVIRRSIFPKCADSEFLFINKLKGVVNVYIVEFIFSKQNFIQNGGFENFDLAWGTDTATWMKLGLHGIETISDAYVFWRSSGDNITTQNNNAIAKRKLIASNSFLLWSKHFWKENKRCHTIFTDLVFVKRLMGFTQYLSIHECIEDSKVYIGINFRKVYMLTLIHIYHFIHKILHK